MVKDVLLLGSEHLYKKSSPVLECELCSLKQTVQDLHDTLLDFRGRYGAGRAIAAPQIGIFKRLIYMNVDRPVVIINPELKPCGDDTFTVLDDCMCFPGLLVKVSRFKKCTLLYKDMDFKDNVMKLEGSLSELIQHEYDHIDGILATMRAIDGKSFFMKS